MKRLVLLGLMLGSLGFAACAVESGDPSPEPATQRTDQLGVQAPQPSTDGEGDPGDPSQTGTARDIHPSDIAAGADPSGPSPYPWNPKVEEDPNGGPSPYPWKGSTTSGKGTNAGTDDTSVTAPK